MRVALEGVVVSRWDWMGEGRGLVGGFLFFGRRRGERGGEGG